MQTARQVNDSKPLYVVGKVLELAGATDTIACLGLTYKANTDDLRESPAMQVVRDLAARHAGQILAVEPNIDGLPQSLRDARVERATLQSALSHADMIVVLVDHQQFRAIPYQNVSMKKIYDSRGIWTIRPGAGVNSEQPLSAAS